MHTDGIVFTEVWLIKSFLTDHVSRRAAINKVPIRNLSHHVRNVHGHGIVRLDRTESNILRLC